MQIAEITDKLAKQQTALYAIILRDDVPPDVIRALLAMHGNLSDVMGDLMSSEETGR